MPTDCLSKIFKEVPPSPLSALMNRLEPKGSTPTLITVSDLPTSPLFTVVENWAIDVLLDASSINEHILAILPDKQKVTVQKYTPVSIV